VLAIRDRVPAIVTRHTPDNGIDLLNLWRGVV
jgi:hypothetical protein